MEDYPRTLGEFAARFATEEACRAFLVQARWPTRSRKGVWLSKNGPELLEHLRAIGGGIERQKLVAA